MTTADRIRQNLARLGAALPEGAKATPPAGEMGMPPPNMPAPAAAPPKPAKPKPPPVMTEPDDGEEGDDEATKSFYDGCKGNTCGQCVPCITKQTSEAGKAAGGAATAEVGAEVLAKLIGGAVRAEIAKADARRATADEARFKSIESTLEVMSLGINGALEVGLKSAEAMGHIASQPAATAPRPGVAAGAQNPGAARSGATTGNQTNGGVFPLTEPEVLKAVHAGMIDGSVMQAWWNAGHPFGAGEEGINVPLPPGVAKNFIEAVKALP